MDKSAPELRDMVRLENSEEAKDVLKLKLGNIWFYENIGNEFVYDPRKPYLDYYGY